MRTIASVAVQHLEAFDKALFAPGWDDRLKHTFCAWNAMRASDNLGHCNMNEWRDTVSRTVKSMINAYKTGETKDRNYWSETYSIRVSITIMAGFKDCPKWQVDICLGVVDHGLKYN